MKNIKTNGQQIFKNHKKQKNIQKQLKTIRNQQSLKTQLQNNEKQLKIINND